MVYPPRLHIFVLSLLLSCVFLLRGIEGAKTDRTLKIAGIGPWNNPFADFLTFAKFVCHLINHNDANYTDVYPGILPDVTLQIDTYDTGQTDQGTAAIMAVNSGQNGLLAYMGGARTTQQIQVVYVADTLKIPYVGGIVSGATFSNKQQFPMFMRTSLTDDYQVLVMVKYIIKQGIKDIAIVYQDGDFGVGNFEAFLRYCDQFAGPGNVRITAFKILTGRRNFEDTVAAIKSSSRKAIVLLTEFAEGYAFMRDAYNGGIVGDEYNWMISQVFTQTFSGVKRNNTEKEWVRGATMFRPITTESENAKIIEKYWSQLPANEFKVNTPRTPIDSVALQMADSFLTIAIGFDRYIKAGENATHINGTKLYQMMCNMNFPGTTGPNVAFTKSCDRIGVYAVWFYDANLTFLESAHYIPEIEDFVDFRPVIYNSGNTTRPRDLPCPCKNGGVCELYSQVCICSPPWEGEECQIKNSFRRHNVGLSIALGAVVGASIIISLIALAILFFFPSAFKQKSPLFCGIIVMGTIIAYIGALTLLPEPTDNLCMIFPWFVGIGFTFVYGCLFLKTWRVYHIINSSMKMERVTISNFYIIRLIAAAVLVEVGFLIIWMTVSPLKAEIRPFQDDTTRYVCSGKNEVIFWGIFAGYKFLWMIFGAILAVKTRGYYDEYNESRPIALSIYNTIAALTIGIPIAASLREFPYVVIVVQIALVVLIFNFTLFSLFFNLWITIFFGSQAELPELPNLSNSKNSGSNSKSSGSGNSHKSDVPKSGSEQEHVYTL